MNRVALLDPNDTQIDHHSSAPGLVEMREVLSVIGPTPDSGGSRRSQCSKGVVYQRSGGKSGDEQRVLRQRGWTSLSLESRPRTRWIRRLLLNQGLGQPYVPSVMGPDGTVYTLNGGNFFALGSVPGLKSPSARALPICAKRWSETRSHLLRGSAVRFRLRPAQ